MREKKTVLIVRFISEEPIEEDAAEKFKDIFDVDFMIMTQEESPKEHLHYPHFEVVEL